MRGEKEEQILSMRILAHGEALRKRELRCGISIEQFDNNQKLLFGGIGRSEEDGWLGGVLEKLMNSA